jgi:hypothetical protein
MVRKRFNADDEEAASYDEHWARIRCEFFKLETLQLYADDYSPGFRDYAIGDIGDGELVRRLRAAMAAEPDPWREKVRVEGLCYNRVHVVDLPLSQYLRYEINSYRISAELGERIFLITRADACALAPQVPIGDFIMFDSGVVLAQYYDESGTWLYTDLLEDPQEVAGYVSFKTALLQRATPFEEFLEEHAALV